MLTNKIIHPELKKILFKIYDERFIGGKHLPERVIKKKFGNLSKHDRKECLRQWNELIQKEIILIHNKRTGRSNEPHFCINPKKLEELSLLI